VTKRAYSIGGDSYPAAEAKRGIFDVTARSESRRHNLARPPLPNGVNSMARPEWNLTATISGGRRCQTGLIRWHAPPRGRRCQTGLIRWHGQIGISPPRSRRCQTGLIRCHGKIGISPPRFKGLPLPNGVNSMPRQDRNLAATISGGRRCLTGLIRWHGQIGISPPRRKGGLRYQTGLIRWRGGAEQHGERHESAIYCGRIHFHRSRACRATSRRSFCC
jgi:hypothetical protein